MKITPMPPAPMILISRSPRQIGDDWGNARSWFGGAPRLGGLAWPRGEAGKPLHFLAQIDLSEIAATAGDTPLPRQGSLAFFVGRTIFVANPGDGPPSLPPADTPDLTNCGGDSEWPFDREGRALFPFWPIDFTRLDIEAPDKGDEDDRLEALEAAQNAAIDAVFVRREYQLSADAVFAGPPIPDWWQCAIFVAEKLAEALKNAPKVLQSDENMLAYAKGKLDEARRDGAQAIEQAQASAPPTAPTGGLAGLLRQFGRREAAPDQNTQRQLEQARRKAAEAIKKAEASVTLYENRIVKLLRLLPGLAAFAAEVAEWTRGRDPWSLMAPDDRAQLGVYWARMTEFPEYTVHYGVTPIDYLKKQMFDKLPGEADPAFAALPADVRSVIAGRRAPHPQWWRTIIAFANDIQDALARRKPHSLNSKREKLAAAGPDKAAELAELDAKVAAFCAFAQEMSAWTQGRAPLRPLSGEETAELSKMLARFEALREIASAYYVKRLSDFERHTLVMLASADDDAYATLPPYARALINERYLLPTGIPHQMFGQAVFIQGDSCAQAEEGKLLLLQLGYDDMMFWSFGDNGAYTFWISPEDLARGKWDAVTMVFECH